MKGIQSLLLIIIFTIGVLLTTPIQGSASWWDKFGEPEYGGTIITVKRAVVPVFDPYAGGYPGWQPWLEGLLAWDWALDREVWSFKYHFVPIEYHTGLLAESWEQPDPKSILFHIRKGVKWQNKPPVNGREFTAYDVQYHYDRILGSGSGFDKPSQFRNWISVVEKVTAKDKYTVLIEFNQPGFAGIWQLLDMITLNKFVPREWVEQGDMGNWKNVVGTGPWVLTDFVAGSSMTVTRNKDYYGHDERHPKNQLPYAGELKALAIEDVSTQLAALRTRKIDVLADLSWQQRDSLMKSNPDLQLFRAGTRGSLGLQMRIDRKPFDDIRVRKALQLAIDLDTIAKTHYNGTVDGIPGGLVLQDYKDYCFPYKEWPQALKDEYKYNPEKAKQLLADAGYPNGFKTDTIACPMHDMELIQVIKSYFQDIGVELEIKVFDVATYFAYASKSSHEQMASYGATPSSNPQKIIRTFYSKNPGDNWAGVNDPEYDGLVEKFNSAVTMDETKQYLKDADKYVLGKHWAIATLPQPSWIACQPYIKGYSGEVIQASWNDWFTLSRIWLDQGQKASMGR